MSIGWLISERSILNSIRMSSTLVLLSGAVRVSMTTVYFTSALLSLPEISHDVLPTMY